MSHAYPPGDTAVVGRRLAALERRVIACRLRPRLVEHREHMGEVKRPRYAGWEYWSRPVPGFGDPSASLMVVGLAPADGANRTGRLFSGDLSVKFLMAALHQAGFANQPTVGVARAGMVGSDHPGKVRAGMVPGAVSERAFHRLSLDAGQGSQASLKGDVAQDENCPHPGENAYF